MTEEMKQKMDELAEDAAQFCTCTGIVCHGCEKANKSNFSKGFDACYKLMEAENAELKRKVLSFRQSMSASAQKSREVWTREEELSIENSALKSRIEKLELGLKFYAHDRTWEMKENGGMMDIAVDRGHRARAALKADEEYK